MHEQISEAEIRAFQQKRGLTVTGVLDSVTAAQLEESQWKLGDRVLSLTTPMMRGDDVAELQSRLVEMGFNCGRVDGIFGQFTENSVKELQKSVGGKVDGACGPQTVISLLRLKKIVSGGTPNQLRDEVVRAEKGPALANKRIVIDPSHTLGADITLDIAQRVEGRLLALGVSVFLTRSSSTTPTVTERIQFANNSNADLVISLGLDTYPNEKAHGCSAFFYGAQAHGIHSVVGERFAILAQRELCARTDLLNCRTHAKTWDLLRLTKAPTVRLNLGYLSNPGDAARLADEEFRESIVEALLVAIQRLYLSAEDDAKTGTLKVSDLRRAGLRK